MNGSSEMKSRRGNAFIFCARVGFFDKSGQSSKKKKKRKKSTPFLVGSKIKIFIQFDSADGARLNYGYTLHSL